MATTTKKKKKKKINNNNNSLLERNGNWKWAQLQTGDLSTLKNKTAEKRLMNIT